LGGIVELFLGLLKSWTRTTSFLGKDVIETVRRPGALFSLIFGPFLIMGLFGIGYSGQYKPLNAVLVVPARGPWLALALAAMGLVVYVESPILQAFLADEAPMTQRDAIFSLYFAVAFGVGALWAAGVGAAIGRLGFGFVFVMMAATYLVAGACVLGMREGAPAPAPVRR